MMYFRAKNEEERERAGEIRMLHHDLLSDESLDEISLPFHGSKYLPFLDHEEMTLIFDLNGDLLVKTADRVDLLNGPVLCMQGKSFLLPELSEIPDQIEIEGMKFTFIPGGLFQMGSPKDSNEHQENEGPWQIVQAPFFLQESLVSRSQYLKLIHSRPWEKFGDFYDNDFESYPASGLSENMVSSYLRRIRQKTGMALRLPTESEFEFVSRMRGATRYPWEPQEPEVILPVPSMQSPRLMPVLDSIHGFHPKLNDLFGSLLHWCQGYYLENDPVQGAKLRRGSYPMYRGASYACEFPKAFRLASRNPFYPDSRQSLLGFRLALDLDSARSLF